MQYFILFITGLIGGFVAGFLGIGGGIVYVLVLPFFLQSVGIHEQEMVQFIIANSIFGTFFAALSGSIMQIKTDVFYWKEVKWITWPSILCALLVLFLFVNTPYYSKKLFTILLIIVLLAIVLKAIWNIFQNKKQHNSETEDKKLKPYQLNIIGAFAGIISALSGLGGGAVIVPILHTILKVDIKKAKSISLGMIFFSALSMTLLNLFEKIDNTLNVSHTGYIVWPVILPMALGVVLASPLGVKVAQKLPDKIIAIVFILFLILVIIKKITFFF